MNSLPCPLVPDFQHCHQEHSELHRRLTAEQQERPTINDECPLYWQIQRIVSEKREIVLFFTSNAFHLLERMWTHPISFPTRSYRVQRRSRCISPPLNQVLPFSSQLSIASCHRYINRTQCLISGPSVIKERTRQNKSIRSIWLAGH